MELWTTSTANQPHESNVVLGTCIILTCSASFSCIQVFQRVLLARYDSLLITFTYYSIGTGFTALLCVGWYSRFHSGSFDFDGATLPWIALFYAGVFASGMNYNIFTFVSKVLSPSIVTIYLTFQPVGTVILSLMILGYLVTLSQGIGGLLVCVGLVVTVYGRELELKSLGREGLEVGVENSGGGYSKVDEEGVNESEVIHRGPGTAPHIFRRLSDVTFCLLSSQQSAPR